MSQKPLDSLTTEGKDEADTRTIEYNDERQETDQSPSHEANNSVDTETGDSHDKDVDDNKAIEMNTENALQAAKQHDFPKLSLILQTCDEIDINCTDHMGKTILHYVCAAGRLDECKLCLDRHANANILDKIGWTPLHYATLKGQNGLVRLLASHGADCNLKDKQKGRTPLHYAVSKNLSLIVETLLQHGADPCIEDEEAKSPGQLAKSEALKDRIDEAISLNTDAIGNTSKETREIPCDRLTPFPVLGASVMPVGVSAEMAKRWQGFTLSISREPFDSSSQDFVLQDNEELCSDVYLYKISRSPSHVVHLDVTVPVLGAPGENEEIVIKSIGNVYHEVTEFTEQSGVFLAKSRMELTALSSFIVVCRPIQERFKCGTSGGKIKSSVDSRVELEMEKGTFTSPTTITLEITQPPPQPDMESVLKKCDLIKSTTSFYGLESGGHPLVKPINVKIPLNPNYGQGKILVLTMDAVISEEKPENWRVVDTTTTVTAGRVEFPVASFCVKVAVEISSSMSDFSDFGSSASLASQVSKVFRRARRKEHTVVMYCMTKRVGTSNSFRLLVQCCKDNQAQTKQKQLEDEGFDLHDQDKSPRGLTTGVKARDKFRVDVSGLNIVGHPHNNFLEFHPKADNNMVFVVALKTNEKFGKGSVTVIKLEEDGESEGGEDGRSSDTVVKAEVVLERFNAEMMNKKDGRSFLTYKRMVRLQQEIGQQWWKVFLLMEVPFKVLETYCKENTSEEQVVNGLLFDWRERNQTLRSRGIPMLMSALYRSSLRSVAQELQIELRKWKKNPENKDEPFYEWLKTAYKHDFLVPSCYDVPLSDSFLAMIADMTEPSVELGNALGLPTDVISDVFADNKTYPTAGMKTMKLLDLYRTASTSGQARTLSGLRRALTAVGNNKALHGLEASVAAWLKHSNKEETMRREVEAFLSEKKLR